MRAPREWPVAVAPAPGLFRLVVFYLDGTMVDTRRDLAEATNTLIAELGGTALDEALIGGLVGNGVAIWLARALAAAGIQAPPADALARFSGLYDQGLLNHTRAYPGIPEALAQAGRAAPLAVLTNKLRRATLKILDGLDLAQHFAEVGGVDGPYPPKPAPEGLVAQMRRFGATAPATLLVGDSPIDQQTARNAGARLCVARYGFGYVPSPPALADGDEFFIDQPAELPALLGI